MRHHSSRLNIMWATLFFITAALSLNACGDVSTAPAPKPGPVTPGPLEILTADPLPAGAVGVDYNVTLAPNGGNPPYTWSLTPGSPTLPNGLAFLPASGKILGVPTAVTGTILTEFKLQDSKGVSVQKVLSITVNASPTPLTILTSSPLPSGSINQSYAIALSGTGGITPYTWGLKAGSPPLPSGLSLDPNGVLSGTPTVTSDATHTFTLTDATPKTVEKSLQLSIKAIPLSITTVSLPQGTANQNYSAQLAASGGTGAYTWGLAGGSPALPAGLTLDTSTGAITGLPAGTSNQNITFTVTDQTPPTPQTASTTLQLIVGSAPPTLTISTSTLPSGTVLQSYSTTLATAGGTGTKTWDIESGSLPAGLGLSTSGVISGTPVTSGTSSPTFRARDSGSPQQTATKQLSLTINLPAAPHITSTSPLPSGTFNVAYNQTVSVTGGIGTLVWGVISGALPPGLSLNASTGNLSGTSTSTGAFSFRLRVTDSVPQSDEKDFAITINPPAPPSIAAFTLPTGVVNQAYPNTQLTATGGALPYAWSVTPALPNGLSLNLSSGVISGTPLSGSNGVTTHTFTVTDSTAPTHQTDSTAPKTLTINASVTPLTITTASLPAGTVGQPYTAPSLAASGGTAPYDWSLNGGASLPAGLSLSASGGITGTPTSSGTTSTTFKVLDATSPNQQSATKAISITINP
jgi:hypothetical protein